MSRHVLKRLQQKMVKIGSPKNKLEKEIHSSMHNVSDRTRGLVVWELLGNACSRIEQWGLLFDSSIGQEEFLLPWKWVILFGSSRPLKSSRTTSILSASSSSSSSLIMYPFSSSIRFWEQNPETAGSEQLEQTEEIDALPGEMGNPNLTQLEKRVKQPISRLHWQHMFALDDPFLQLDFFRTRRTQNSCCCCCFSFWVGFWRIILTRMRIISSTIRACVVMGPDHAWAFSLCLCWIDWSSSIFALSINHRLSSSSPRRRWWLWFSSSCTDNLYLLSMLPFLLRKPSYVWRMYVRASGPGITNERRSRTFRWCALATLFSFSVVFQKILQIWSTLVLLLLLPDCA